MSKNRVVEGPAGGVAAARNLLRRWRWNGDSSEPVRCKAEQWYLVRARPAGEGMAAAALPVEFHARDGRSRAACAALSRAGREEDGAPLLSWLQAPQGASHLRLALTPAARAAFREIEFQPVPERDPKCHPMANVPRWSTYRPAFPLERVVLPASLEALRAEVDWARVEVLDRPRSLRKLAAKAIGAACVVDPGWIPGLGVQLADLERIAAGSWLIIDIPSLAGLAARAGVAGCELVERTSRSGIMSARNEYAELHTRGFALLDVFPYGTISQDGFALRALRATRGWKAYSNRCGFAMVLSSQTPVERHCNDVVAATRAVGQGELIAMDAPWLAAGAPGTPVAPRLARHLARMVLGGPIDEGTQFWVRWNDARIVVRDIADMARRYAPLRPVRWAADDGAAARLGVALHASDAPRRTLAIRTGRIDELHDHGGLAPEAMMIFMRWLAREARERTAWAARHLEGTNVVWQFETAAGLRYAPHYDADGPRSAGAAVTLRVCHHAPSSHDLHIAPHVQVFQAPRVAGVLGDGSLEFQRSLHRRLVAFLEKPGSR